MIGAARNLLACTFRDRALVSNTSDILAVFFGDGRLELADMTTPNITLLLGQVGTLLIGSLGLAVALRTQRRQLNAQMYIEFSKRFEELLRLFPTDAWLANRNPGQPLPPSSPELRDCTLYCIQFIAHAYYLHQGRYIATNLWRLWEREIKRTLSGPLFEREWENVKAEFAHDPQFSHYISCLTQRGR
jgi:hypothetical protein